MIDKAFKILECIAENQNNNTIIAISQQTGIPKSTVHRILTVLAQEEIVLHRQGHGYVLTPKLLSIGYRGLGQKSLMDLAVPIMRNVSQQTSETVSFNVLSGTERICIYRVEGKYPILRNIKIGDRGPLLEGSVGKVLAARMSESELSNIIDKYIKSGEITSEHIPKLLEDLKQVREKGFAISVEERLAGGASVAVPILDVSGQTMATLSISTIVERFTPMEANRYANILCEAAEEISFQTGGMPH
jgi:DNA-binding IclR family transcriptional regulator